MTDTEIKKGNRVKLDYEGRFESGEVFDTSKHGDHSHPLEFEAGAGEVVQGFDKAVLGMKKGEEKEFTIKPEEAYGARKKELIKEFPREMLPEEQREKAKEGMMLVIGTPSGEQFPAKIVKITKDQISLDLNHPLAGKTLIFKIKILDFS